MTLVDLKSVEKVVGSGTSRTWLLRNIDLCIEEGEMVSIMGPSGAGKSTLLHILGMHDAEWSGSYVFDGQPRHELKPQGRAAPRPRDIGFLFPSYHPLADLTVYEKLQV